MYIWKKKVKSFLQVAVMICLLYFAFCKLCPICLPFIGNSGQLIWLHIVLQKYSGFAKINPKCQLPGSDNGKIEVGHRDKTIHEVHWH